MWTLTIVFGKSHAKIDTCRIFRTVMTHSIVTLTWNNLHNHNIKEYCFFKMPPEIRCPFSSGSNVLNACMGNRPSCRYFMLRVPTSGCWYVIQTRYVMLWLNDSFVNLVYTIQTLWHFTSVFSTVNNFCFYVFELIATKICIGNNSKHTLICLNLFDGIIAMYIITLD